MADVICVGELLVEFVSQANNVSLEDAPGFIKAPGGAPGNVAVAMYMGNILFPRILKGLLLWITLIVRVYLLLCQSLGRPRRSDGNFSAFARIVNPANFKNIDLSKNDIQVMALFQGFLKF